MSDPDNSQIDENHNPWQTLSKRDVYDNPWIKIEEHQVINPGGGRGIYGLIHFKHLAIGIVPVDKREYTWLVGQYRYPLKRYSWEIPEGGGPLYIPPVESAKRELLEECGIVAGKWDLIQELELSNSTSDELGLLYVARDLKFEAPQPTEDEQLQIKRLPLAEAADMVRNGNITDSLSVVGLLRAQEWLKTNG